MTRQLCGILARKGMHVFDNISRSTRAAPTHAERDLAMKKVISFIVWPALAGLVFALILLQAPRIAGLFPGLLPQDLGTAASNGPTDFSTLSFNAAIRKAVPAVVSINNLQLINRQVRIRLTPYITGVRNLPDETSTLGSGVIISPEGYIVTSYHVMFNPELEIIRPEVDINITLNDGRTTEARVVFLDAKNDLALLKIDAEGLSYLEPPEHRLPQTGDIVLAIGNPRNIGQSSSFGIISALWGRGDSYVIQTDAAINPGNSGGALIDIEGNFIGVNSTIVSESGGSEGISFAVPASKAMELLEQYLDVAASSDQPGYLGVNADPITREQGRIVFGQEIEGFHVNSVTPKSAADMAGLQSGDVIIGVNDQALSIQDTTDKDEAYKSIAMISALKPGTLVMLDIYRDERSMRIPIVLGYGNPRIFDPREEVGQPLDVLQVPADERLEP